MSNLRKALAPIKRYPKTLTPSFKKIYKKIHKRVKPKEERNDSKTYYV